MVTKVIWYAQRQSCQLLNPQKNIYDAEFIVNPIIQFLKQLILGPQIFEKLKAFHIPDFIEAVKFDFVLILAIFYKENLLDYVPHNKDATKWVWQNIEEA